MKKNTDQHDQEQEARSAPSVKTGTLHHVFHRQRMSVFHTVDAFVLCAMIHEGPADVLHPGDQDHIAQEKGQLDKRFHDGDDHL